MRDLELLATFLEVRRAGSVTAAASRLGLSQPSVSERLARLEEQFGETLLVRSSRGVTPTPAGDRLAARIGDPVDRLRAAWTAEPATDASGTVRIGGASDVVASRVIPALAPLAAQGIRLEFALGRAQPLLESLKERRLDVVIASIRPADAAIRYRGLVDEEFVLVGAPSLARAIDARRLGSDPAGALVHLPLVVYDEELSIVRRYWRSQFGHRPANPVAIVVPDLRGILAAVVAGAGISAIPRYLADPAVASGSVEILHRPEESPINTLHIAIPVHEPPSAATAAVITRLLETARAWDSF
ncbi:LysR family transcriptional regulator [Microbacterium ulmi]|uniref:LysR family transcriptional regulator n=1 Tax=Microbacterium ulmi TaxID=179095 RepID=A0A7Y2M0I1_9MICO|nr:LysR family transcriptional regulator [Microbacterium ulmi]NII70837.1 DNA-binding transcriptional LysR family regulator [Microbacterium ulmi]NNH02853.1 LysR family transcriptional regulator [Microbacterium ulmi]